MIQETLQKLDNIDVNELIRDFKIPNTDNFISYLKDVWKDLAERSDPRGSKGINKITFNKYYELPGLISDRLFDLFNRKMNEYIKLNEFIEGMTSIFTESFEKMIKLVFNLYDFDNDGRISKEDVRLLLSHLPLKTIKCERLEFKDQVESQDELSDLVSKCFPNDGNMDYSQFITTVEKVSSDIFLFIIILLHERKPFSNSTINQFQISTLCEIKNPSTSTTKTPSNLSHILASPNLNSKFSASNKIANSPSIKKRLLKLNESDISRDFLNKLCINKNLQSRNLLNKYLSNITVKEDDKEIDECVTARTIPVSRKNRNNLKNIEDVKKSKFKSTMNEISENLITPAVKYNKKSLILLNNDQQSEDLKYDSDEDKFDVKYESYILKISKSKKIKKLWYKIIGKDIYCYIIYYIDYLAKEDKVHQGMHNLSGVFINEENTVKIDDVNYYCFSLNYPQKRRLYYLNDETDYENWLNCIRIVTGYSIITDKYYLKEKIGSGRFSLVRLGVHKVNQNKVAIKIISKKEMDNKDIEMVNTEIEILKLCRHPSIIRFYEVFENLDYIYIIMEYCAGGDLFSYLESRSFKLSENHTASIIHKLSTSVYYLHSYGIVHRDLKPENILMTDTTDNADIRLLDFGLSKLSGPNEPLKDPFGTISYVAPEILLEKPYSKAVDLWSIGVMTYLMLCGFLPFDDESSQREIARQTINEPAIFPNYIWKKFSVEAKQFVDSKETCK